MEIKQTVTEKLLGHRRNQGRNKKNTHGQMKTEIH